MENALPLHTYVVAVHSDYYMVKRIRFKPTKMTLKQFARSKYYQIVDKYGYPFEIYVDGSETPVPYPIPHHRQKKTVTINESQLREVIAEAINEWSEMTAAEIERRDAAKKAEDERRARETADATERSKMAKKFFGSYSDNGRKYGDALNEEGIHIKEKNRGKFNATKERTGKSTEELTHSKNPLTRKRAVFAQNAKSWNKKK